VNKKPPELPNIEDATLRACLAPLVDAMNNGVESAPPVNPATIPIADAVLPRVSPGSNDNRTPSVDTIAAHEPDCSAMPKTLAEWRSLADEDFGAFRTIDHFLGMTEADLETAAAEFPKQIGGTMRRIACLKSRLAMRYDAATTVNALLERAMARVAASTAIDRPPTNIASRPSPGSTT
jgi:hypothetical protein